MKQITLLIIVIAIVAAIVLFMKQNPEGFKAIKRETTTKTKYAKEGESPDIRATEYKKEVKPDKEGSTVTVKEKVKYSEI